MRVNVHAAFCCLPLERCAYYVRAACCLRACCLRSACVQDMYHHDARTTQKIIKKSVYVNKHKRCVTCCSPLAQNFLPDHTETCRIVVMGGHMQDGSEKAMNTTSI